MKIYIVTNEAFPNGMAATNRIKCLAKALIVAGVDCEVLIFLRRERPWLKKPVNIQGVGCWEGVHFRYTGGTPINSNNPIKRKFDRWLDRKRLLSYLKKNLTVDDAVLFYMGREVELTLKIMEIAHKKGASCTRDLCEYPFGTGVETKETIEKRSIIQTKQLPHIDGIIAISDALIEYARKYTNEKCSIIKIPILVDFDKYKLDDKSDETEIPYIFHSGTLYEQKDGILGMIEAYGKALSILKSPIRFISTGILEKSPVAKDIEVLIREYKLEGKLIFKGYLSEEQLKEYLSKASLVIINKNNNRQNQYCFSTKLGEYLAAGKPVIITRVGEAVNWLQNEKDAYIIEPNNPDILANTIVDAFSKVDGLKEIGCEGRNTCRKYFDYNVWANPLKEFYDTLILNR